MKLVNPVLMAAGLLLVYFFQRSAIEAFLDAIRNFRGGPPTPPRCRIDPTQA